MSNIVSEEENVLILKKGKQLKNVRSKVPLPVTLPHWAVSYYVCFEKRSSVILLFVVCLFYSRTHHIS